MVFVPLNWAQYLSHSTHSKKCLKRRRWGKRREGRREGGRALNGVFHQKDRLSVLGVEDGGGKEDKSLADYLYMGKKNKTKPRQTSNKNKYLDYQQYKIIVHCFPIKKKKKASELLLEVIDSICTHPLMTGGVLPPPPQRHTHISVYLCAKCLFSSYNGHSCLQSWPCLFFFFLFKCLWSNLLTGISPRAGLGCVQTRLNNSCWEF